MLVTHAADLDGPGRRVTTDAYTTTRLLLEADGAGLTLTDVTLVPGVERDYGDPERTEVAYCLEGEATLTELASGATHTVTPGTLWVARPGERFRFRAAAPTRLVCVFDPPFTGPETGFAPPAETVVRVPSPSRYAEPIGFSAATRAGGHVHVAGTTGADAGPDPEAQARAVLRKVVDALAAAGARPADVVRTRTYLVDAADWEAVGRAHAEVFGAHRPAATMVVVAALLDPRMRVEIEADAYVGG